jgi:hypothetical protein
MSNIQSKVVRLVGVAFTDQNDRLDKIARYGLRETEYSNEFELDLELNKTFVLQGVKF